MRVIQLAFVAPTKLLSTSLLVCPVFVEFNTLRTFGGDGAVVPMSFSFSDAMAFYCIISWAYKCARIVGLMFDYNFHFNSKVYEDFFLPQSLAVGNLRCVTIGICLCVCACVCVRPLTCILQCDWRKQMSSACQNICTYVKCRLWGLLEVRGSVL